MDYGFQLDPGETIIRVVHRHIFDLIPTIAVAAILALAAVGVAYITGRFSANIPLPPIVTLLIVVTMIGLSGIIVLVGVYVYRRNVLVFTNVHCVQVEQLALFQRRVSQLSFLRVEDVTGRRVGIVQTLFNFGDVQVQSAGEQEKFIFKNAPNPELLADEVLQIHEESMRANSAPAQPGGVAAEAAK